MVISLYLFPFLYVIAVRGRRINLAQGAGNAKTGTDVTYSKWRSLKLQSFARGLLLNQSFMPIGNKYGWTYFYSPNNDITQLVKKNCFSKCFKIKVWFCYNYQFVFIEKYFTCNFTNSVTKRRYKWIKVSFYCNTLEIWLKILQRKEGRKGTFGCMCL